MTDTLYKAKWEVGVQASRSCIIQHGSTAVVRSVRRQQVRWSVPSGKENTLRCKWEKRKVGKGRDNRTYREKKKRRVCKVEEEKRGDIRKKREKIIGEGTGTGTGTGAFLVQVSPVKSVEGEKSLCLASSSSILFSDERERLYPRSPCPLLLTRKYRAWSRASAEKERKRKRQRKRYLYTTHSWSGEECALAISCVLAYVVNACPWSFLSF